MDQQISISLLTRRAEEVAICAHFLEEIGIKPISISINENYALICINRAPPKKKVQGQSVGSTCVKGNYFIVHQALINNVIVKWLEPFHDAQATAKKVH
jgi:hypothetical protein